MSSSLSSRQIEFSKKVGLLLHFATLHYIDITLGEAWRPQVTQEYYYKHGISKVKYGNHQRRLAIDLNVFLNGKYRRDRKAYEPLGQFAKKIGLTWGGDWKTLKDYGHFELSSFAKDG